MCGIVGFTQPECLHPDNSAVIQAMTKALDHRGPDDSGVWMDADAGVALGHARLSILDLSPAGHQPMVSAGGRYVIVFNGEIYNHLELRARLAGSAYAWRGHSDTETLLACFEAWGVEDTLRECVGMFALALWDRQTRSLVLARDRFGEKPLYYGWNGRRFFFASELKAIEAHPSFSAPVNRDALALMMRFGHVPAPFSIYQGISKLGSGCSLTIPYACTSDDARSIQPVPYWSLEAVSESGRRAPFTGTDEQAIDLLAQTLSEAVRGQQLADVPVGAFLSGGIDSSLVVALMQSQSSQPVRTFTIGFDEAAFDEAAHARAIAVHLGTQHTEFRVKPEDALRLIPALPQIYDEPFADPSQIPTYLVAKLARAQVTVALSGDGGDELFAGYNRYPWAQKVNRRLQWLPGPMRGLVSSGMVGVPVGGWDAMNKWLSPLLPASMRMVHLGDKMHKLADALEARSSAELYRGVMSLWKSPGQLVLGSREPPVLIDAEHATLSGLSFAEWMMLVDAQASLQDDMLVKVDRAAMAVSLETRVPLLDLRVAALAWRLPMSMKIRDGKGKWILRQLLYRHVPQALVDRPKQGFSVPVGEWLKGPLREWAEGLLDERRLRAEGYFDAGRVRAAWLEHLSGRRHWPLQLWCVLMFQSWLSCRAGSVHTD
ncbi:asparagine synthase (glutamine-hydrolyzing) [Crenobacter intestini]|uniref:asparagine synthase (glutamine-hydrolyzing) n=1 Tax=Crenobacter intestini TaxID=2563443 RepID=A0A4T0V2F1_9NEIS|nr:asparagine synthase (glutamine-hydrolyzing) [Crenobacter intestini]TIC85335.1 asparagine synthase (glutamine-hydrolyzing) [Crenobacter intestini]